jgi:hypothetical protein
MRFYAATLSLFAATFTHAQACPEAARNGTERTGTDYYDASRAACLQKEIEALKKSIFAMTSNRPDLAWNVTSALLCGTDEKSKALINQLIVNPLRHRPVFTMDADHSVYRRHQKALGLMQRGCAFSPEVKRISNSSIQVTYTPYSPGGYCGGAVVFKYRENNWYIVEKHEGCD